MEEEWRDIEGFEGRYQVSNLGRVKSIERYRLTSTGKTTHCNERIITPRLHNKGYYTISLWDVRNGEKYREQRYVHRMVASAFIPNYNNYPCVNHIDNNPSNNCVDNLEWCTHKMNTAHAMKQSRLITPVDMGYRKHKQPYRVCLVDGTHIGDYPSIADAMIAIGENPNNHAPINNIRQGKPYKKRYIFSKLPRIKNSIV